VLQWGIKDPDEVLDYQIDWAREGDSRLEDGETLLTSNFSVAEGDVVIDNQAFSAPGLTTVWLSGGTVGTMCVILNRVTTSGGAPTICPRG
jgi:hypothetical protein